ncbi:hypothetical protein F4561_005624 [Lipingzhangella halophila]|uniref:Uncharacterized protein n=1 Tax=Lipingzhangella halophila TaxID=1783352 RepID=A0A7W7RMH8_9ACTN|nr:hypothetical protein [Lipingzhangella halophila]
MARKCRTARVTLNDAGRRPTTATTGAGLAAHAGNPVPVTAAGRGTLPVGPRLSAGG